MELTQIEKIRLKIKAVWHKVNFGENFSISL
jgi:hypothetical protein